MLMNNTYQIAGKNFRLVSIFKDVQDFCQDYRSFGKPEFTLQTSPEDIRKANEAFPGGPVSEGRAEIYAVQHLLAVRMVRFNTLLVHASAVALDNEAYLFLARSGTGKSTHAGFWKETFGDRAVILNDDKPFVKVGKGGLTVYGTPWSGKDNINTNASVPAAAVCLLERSPHIYVEPISAVDALPVLFRQTYHNMVTPELEKLLGLIHSVPAKAPVFRIGVSLSRNSAVKIYQGITKRIKGESVG